MTYRLSSRFQSTPWKEQIKSKFKRTVIPYFVFGSLSYLYWLLIERRFRVDTNVSVYKPLFGMFWGSGSDNLTFNAALWFLPCLFIVFCLFLFVESHYTGTVKIICYLILISMGVLIEKYLSTRLPWGVDVALFALFFLLVGYYMYSYLENLNGLSLYLKIWFAIISLSINIPVALWNGVTGMASVIYGNVVLFIIASVSGSAAVIEIAQIIKSNTVLEFFGINSIIIMCIHEPIRRIVIKLFSILIRVDVSTIRDNVLYSFFVCFIVILIVCPACIIVRNKMKWMLGIKSK